MNITVSKSEIYNKLKAIGKIIQPKNSLPAYDNFLFSINATGELHITAGEEGGRLSARICCTADFISECFLVPAKFILDGLKDIPEQPIIISIDKSSDKDGDKYNIRCSYSAGKGKFTMLGTSSNEFPLINVDSDESPISVFSQDFLYGIRQVQICTANDELRPVMNGVYFDKVDDKITYVGTNGNILGIVETKLESGTGRSAFIIPDKYTRILSNIIPNDCNNIAINSDSKNISFEFGDYTLICRMIEGRYPNYRTVIPTNLPKKVTLVNQDLLSAIKRVSVFASRAMPIICLDVSDKQINLTAKDYDLSTSAEEQVEVDSFIGGDIEIGLNSNFLKELLSNIPSEKVNIEMTDPSRAALLSRADEDTSSLTYLIMPISINH